MGTVVDRMAVFPYVHVLILRTCKHVSYITWQMELGKGDADYTPKKKKRSWNYSNLPNLIR